MLELLERPTLAVPQRRTVAPRAGGGRGSRPDQPGREKPEGAPRPSPARFPVLLTGVHVLLVDDDPDILELFTMALTVCGAEVTVADNARAGLAAAQARRPAVVVSDIAMPGEDGYWLVRALRAVEALAEVPVLAVTAYGREHSRSRALLAGFQEHLQKPVDPETLCRVVARLVGR